MGDHRPGRAGKLSPVLSHRYHWHWGGQKVTVPCFDEEHQEREPDRGLCGFLFYRKKEAIGPVGHPEQGRYHRPWVRTNERRAADFPGIHQPKGLDRRDRKSVV